jgi:kynurenine formamidase
MRASRIGVALAGVIAGVAFGAGIPGGFAQESGDRSVELPDGRLVDLTHPFNRDAIYWPTAKRFRLEKVADGETEGGYHYEANNFSAAEHGGTHLDAPAHFAADAATADEVSLARVTGDGVVVDVTAAAAANRDYRVTVADLDAFEAEHGRLRRGDIVLLRTGFGRFWPDREKYMGTADRGADAVPKLHFPGLHEDAAARLVARRVGAVGLDTPSIDYGQSTLFESHRVLGKAGIPVFENVANLHRLPEEGFAVIALPMKIEGGSGGPLRAMAIVAE